MGRVRREGDLWQIGNVSEGGLCENETPEMIHFHFNFVIKLESKSMTGLKASTGNSHESTEINPVRQANNCVARQMLIWSECDQPFYHRQRLIFLGLPLE